MNSTASTTSIARPLQLFGRRDLIAAPIAFRGTRYWSVKDPVSLRYYQLGDEELFILEQLDGNCCLGELKQRFETRFAPKTLDSNQLYTFLGTLYREGLLTSHAAGQGDQLLARHDHGRRQARLQTLTNLLAIRFRGLDPEPFLRVLYPRVRWMFCRGSMFASLFVIFAAACSLIVYAEQFVDRLPRLQTFLSLENALIMMLALAFCKILHELGHALTCKHFGGQCHELGVMLLVFTPCLYCNVSDAWMMRSKWQRIATSAAGIYVELLLASICTFLWWFSQPGILNSIFLNIMVVCSVSTLLFNGNPLLRYDGYFILSDLLELPNLREQSGALLQQLAARCVGIEPSRTWTVDRRYRVQLAIYGIASLIYRWVLIAAILLLVYRVLEPSRLESIALLLAIFVFGGLITPPLCQLIRAAGDPRINDGRRRRRMVVLGVACVSGAILLATLPVSRRVTAPVVLEPANAARVHVTVPGTLTHFVDVGQRVAKGDVLAELTDDELERQLATLRGDRDVRRLYTLQLQKLQVLERGTANDGAGSQIVTAREALAAAERQLDERLRDFARLTITAPRAGIVMADRPRPPGQSHGKLPRWSGTVLDDRNLGCHLDTDTVFCLIGDPRQLKGIALVAQGEIEAIEIGQSVRVLVDELHQHILAGRVTEIARVDVEHTPPELIAKQLLPDVRAGASPAYYAVSITLEPGQATPPLWSSGKASIAVTPVTLADLIYKQLCTTFRIDL